MIFFVEQKISIKMKAFKKKQKEYRLYIVYVVLILLGPFPGYARVICL